MLTKQFSLPPWADIKFLKQDHLLGNFQVGKLFDESVIDPYIDDCPFDVFSDDALHDVVNKFIFLGDDRNITHVFVDGKLIVRRGASSCLTISQ